MRFAPAPQPNSATPKGAIAARFNRPCRLQVYLRLGRCANDCLALLGGSAAETMVATVLAMIYRNKLAAVPRDDTAVPLAVGCVAQPLHANPRTELPCEYLPALAGV